MIPVEQPFHLGDCVKYKDGIDPSFSGGFARFGNEAVVQQVRKDRYGYPQILVAWSHDDWSYNGQEDGWHWSNHFESMEQQPMRYEPIRGTIVTGSSSEPGTHDGNQLASIIDKFTKEIMTLARETLSNG